MDRDWIVRKIMSKLQRNGRCLIVDLFGGVEDVSTRSAYKYARFWDGQFVNPEIYAFRVAKELEKKGILQVEYINGRNWLVLNRKSENPLALWREFWKKLEKEA